MLRRVVPSGVGIGTVAGPRRAGTTLTGVTMMDFRLEWARYVNRRALGYVFCRDATVSVPAVKAEFVTSAVGNGGRKTEVDVIESAVAALPPGRRYSTRQFWDAMRAACGRKAVA